MGHVHLIEFLYTGRGYLVTIKCFVFGSLSTEDSKVNLVIGLFEKTDEIAMTLRESN